MTPLRVEAIPKFGGGSSTQPKTPRDWAQFARWLANVRTATNAIPRYISDLYFPVRTITADSAATDADWLIICDTKLGPITLTVNAGNAINQVITIKNAGPNAVVVAGSTVDGQPTAITTPQDVLQIEWSGTEWISLNRVLSADFPQKAPSLLGSAIGGNLSSSGYTYAVGKLCYVTSDNVAGNGTFSIFDIGNRQAPKLLGQVTGIGAYAEGIVVIGRWAIIAILGTNQILVFDCIDVTAPTLAFTFTDAAVLAPENVFLYGNSILVSCYNASTTAAQLAIIDISPLFAATPAVPTLLSTVVNDGTYGDGFYNSAYIDVQGDWIFLSARGNGSFGALVSINISNLSAPVVGSVFGDSGGPFAGAAGATGVAVRGAYAFAGATARSALVVVNVSDPTAMTLEKELVDLLHFSFISNVHIANGVLFTTAYGIPAGGPNPTCVSTVNIDKPTAPYVQSFYFGTASLSFDHLDINGNIGCVSDTSAVGGLYLFDLGGRQIGTLTAGRIGTDFINVDKDIRIGRNLYVGDEISPIQGARAIQVALTQLVLAGNNFMATETGGATNPVGTQSYGVAFATQASVTVTFTTVYNAATPTLLTLCFLLPPGASVQLYSDASSPPTTLVAEVKN